MISAIFPKVLNMSGTAGFAVLVVVLARLLLSRHSKALACALWAVVLVRLLCPVFPQAPFSIVPELPVSLPRGLIAPLNWVWVAGAAVMLGYGVTLSLVLRQKLRGAEPLAEDVYVTEAVDSPFTMGIAHPKIYLPRGLEAREVEFVLLHERHHIKRLDHVTKPLAWLALSLHWFNPLAWLAFALASADMEMCCDEAVIRVLGEDTRADYSEFLLTMAAGDKRFPGLSPGFGSGSVTGRIKNMKNWKRHTPWQVVLTAVLCATLAGCLLTDPVSQKQGLDYPREMYRRDLLPNMCVDPDGETLYYFLGAAGKSDRILYFLDLQTGISMPVCGKPECPHKSSSCNAWTESGRDVQFYNGQIWFTDGGWSYHMDPDGNNREKATEITNGEFLYYGGGYSGNTFFHRGWAIHGQDLSEIENGITKSGIEVYVQPLDGSGTEPEIVLREWYPGKNLMEDFQPAGNWFYMILKLYDMDVGAKSWVEYPFELKILRWSLTDGTLETVCDRTVDGIYLDEVWVEDESILFTGQTSYGENAAGEVYELDLATGELTKRAALNGTGGKLLGERVVTVGYDDNGGQIKRPVTVTDLDGNVILETVLTDPEPPKAAAENTLSTFSVRGEAGGWLYVEYGFLEFGEIEHLESRLFARVDLATGESEVLGDWTGEVK